MGARYLRDEWDPFPESQINLFTVQLRLCRQRAVGSAPGMEGMRGRAESAAVCQSVSPLSVFAMSTRAVITLCLFAAAASAPPNYNLETNEVIASHLTLSTIPDLVVDFALAELRHYFNDRNITTIDLPDIETSFDEDWMGVHVRGDLRAARGVFRNPATVIRKGAAGLGYANGSVIFTVPVGFSKMEVSFDEYKVSLVGLQEGGRAAVSIRENSVLMEVSVKYVPRCLVKLRKFRFTRLSDVATDITGLSLLDPLADRVLSLIVEHYSSSFTALLESLIQRKIDRILPHTSFCKRHYYHYS